MMRHPVAAACTAAFILLAGCSSEPEVVNNRFDPQAEALKNAPRVQLPPSIEVSRVFRCRDSSLVYVDFLSDDRTANLRTSEAGERTRLTVESEGAAYTAEGFSVSANAAEADIRVPGKSQQSCRANSALSS